jgi:limonene-1,2-epoxide hydrolase
MRTSLLILIWRPLRRQFIASFPAIRDVTHRARFGRACATVRPEETRVFGSRMGGRLMPTENEKTVTELLNSWSRLDFAAAIELVTDSFTYQPDPSAKLINGKDAVLAEWKSYLKFMKSYEFKVLHMLGAGDLVMMERTEWIGTKRGKIELPIMGVFELSGGKISAWRDYWDPRMAGPPPAASTTQS